MTQALLSAVLAKRTTIIRLFQISYVLLLGYVGLVAQAMQQPGRLPIWMGQSGNWLGTAAIVAFIMVTLPGIARRFRISHPLTTLLMSVRRYLGILVALLALAHAQLVYFIPTITSGGVLQFPPPTPILFGSIALQCLLVLMFTSNDFSVRRLGRAWKHLHRLVYGIFWLIFLHVGLMGETKQALVIGAFGALEVLSLVYAFWYTRASQVGQATEKGADV